MTTLNHEQTQLVLDAIRNSLQDTLDYAEPTDYVHGELELSFGRRLDLLRHLGGSAVDLSGKNSYLLNDNERSTAIVLADSAASVEPLTEEETPRYHDHPADRAEAALTAYAYTLSRVRDIGQDHVQDLAQDLIHWLARQDHDCDAPQLLEELVGLAVRDFPMELEEPDRPRHGRWN